MIENQTAQPQHNTETRVTTPLREAPKRPSLIKFLPILIVLAVVGLGATTGLLASSINKSQQISKAPVAADEESLPEEQKVSFSQTFRDSSEGTVEKNDDLDKYAQGTHKLIRPGGESQTAYLLLPHADQIFMVRMAWLCGRSALS